MIMKDKLLPFCECRCGGRVVKLGNRFINGHNGRGRKPTQKQLEACMKNLEKANTPEANAKRSAAKIGVPLSKEHCAKISITLTGVPKTKEHNAKNSAAQIGKKLSKEHIAAFKEANKRPEVKANRTAGQLKRYEDPKEHEISSAVKMGNKNPNWKDGRSKLSYPPEWTEKLRESIRERDGRVCQMPSCGKTEQENGQKLDVHHMDSDKNNCHPSNLISLCKCCHKIVETNSEYWQPVFEEKNCVWLGT